MKKISVLVACLFSLVFIRDINAQKLILNSSITGKCYAGNKITRVYIPPPKGFKERLASKGGGTINVSYTGFTAQGQAAIAYAVSILESMLPADTRMYVKVSWAKISDSGVLANSSITGFASGWSIDALNPGAFYPLAVAEKIAERSINEDFEADVELTVNNTIDWYLGTDGNTPVSKYDLVTVALHELCHGLGIFDSFDVTNSRGTYGIGSYPLIYDTFVEDLAGKRLTDTLEFLRNSTALASELTGGQLYFGGPLTERYLSGGRARLYAPSTWDPGSSVSHLDELRTSQENALMTPFIDYGEAIHNPGNLTFSILGDLGWINTRIIPGEQKDTEEHLTQLEITASVKSDTVYNKNSVSLVYSFDGFGSADTLLMISLSGNDNYNRTISIPGYNVKLDYYIYATDYFSRIYRTPSLAVKEPYTVFIGIDTVKPVITHSPNKYYFEKIDSIPFEATVTDNLGIDTVYVEYNINNSSSRYFGLSATSDDKFERTYNVRPEELKGGDLFNYRIIAIDKSAAGNLRRSPSTGYYTLNIESLESTLTEYSTNFSDASADFFNSGFSITTPPGFSSPSLNSDHPYISPDKDNTTLNFSSVLRHPVIFDQSGMVITYRELVLVEPGAEGSFFGFSDFYDYVIVEGSRNFGRDWFPLADGYDSRIIPAWENDFLSMTDGMNSTFVGQESLMQPHSIYPVLTGDISPGDSLLIRFRLFSDPYANGWGWVIDDLKIGPLVDEVRETVTQDMIIYPNPGDGHLTLVYDHSNNFGPVRIMVFNSTGKCIVNNQAGSDNEIRLDLSGYPSGLYFILLKSDSGIKSVKYSLIK
jgi:hypothetical protein